VRFIRQADVQVRLPADWANQVSTATRAVFAAVRSAIQASRAANESRADRKKRVCKALHKGITDISPTWGNAKAALAHVSADKCWYCECKQDRSDLHVDHFRPKNRVTGESAHSGYWWFALEWTNFRLACTFCNCVREDAETEETGGKGNRFPIFDAPPRMTRRQDPLDRPKLLDPVVRQDVEKLTFRRNGLPEPLSKDPASDDYKCAQETIEVFNLKHSRLKRAREALAIEIDEDVFLADSAYTKADMNAFNIVADRIVSRIRNDAQYAMFARAVLKTYTDKEWINSLWAHL
jgi:uncharacterized protein (TIGR02646 family)